MSPVLFALALDPFLEHLRANLPSDSMIRAYADDMAVILPCGSNANLLPPMFERLAKASSLHVNVSKTVLTPLYPTSKLQAGNDIQQCAWSGMSIELGCSKYLGFLVGPLADAAKNFKTPFEKFKKRASYWLGCTWLGAHLQTLGFNMFALSVLNFISQLYLPPPDMMKQLSDWAGKFARGPRFWLWGSGGHAFFRAGPDIGLKSVPRCPVSACKAWCVNTTHKFLSDHVNRLDRLREGKQLTGETLHSQKSQDLSTHLLQ